MKTNLNHHHKFIAVLGTLTLGSAFLLAGPFAVAHDQKHMVNPAEIEFMPGPPSLPAGTQFAILHGNPGKEGPFVMRLKFPADFVVPPHRHPKEEHVTVMSGGFGMGMGEKLDREAAPLLKAGAFMRIPTGEAHYAWTSEETVVQINAIGPFGIEYVNPSDDPRGE